MASWPGGLTIAAARFSSELDACGPAGPLLRAVRHVALLPSSARRRHAFDFGIPLVGPPAPASVVLRIAP